MRVAVFGASGKVGRVLVPAIEQRGWVVQKRDTRGADAAVDFTTPEAAPGNVMTCIAAGVPVVVGTTGWERNDVDKAARQEGVAVFFAPNFSIGAVLMMRLCQQAAVLFPPGHIVELHDVAKRDAPSGTATATAAAMGTDPDIASVRLPGLVAHQQVVFSAPGEMLTIRHDSFSRESFVPGVLLALEKVRSLPPGLTVGLELILP